MSVIEFDQGNPVNPQDLRYRGAFIAELWELLASNNVVLTAPRRTGKTSVMDYIKTFPEGDALVIYENVQSVEEPAEFVLSILDRLQDEHPDFTKTTLAKSWSFLKGVLKAVDSVGVASFKLNIRDQDENWDANWMKHGDTLFRSLEELSERKIVIIIDEFPDMILNMKRLGKEEEIRKFLSWLRNLRQHPNPKVSNVKWLIGGSVNLSSTLGRMNMIDKINDLETVDLPVLLDEDVEDFVRRMLGGRDVLFDEDLVDAVKEKLGRPIALFMQMFTQELYRIFIEKQSTLTAVDADEAFYRLVRSSSARDKLAFYYSRIRDYYDPQEAGIAYAILNKLSISKNGISRSALRQEHEEMVYQSDPKVEAYRISEWFNQLLVDLENDFYIIEIEEDRYDFASGVLKSWWAKYHGG